MATYLQHVRLMGQLRAAANWRQVGQQESERGRKVVSSLVVVLGSFFIISTLATSSEEATGQEGSAAAARKTKYNKTYDFRLEWGEGKALEVVLTIANARSQLN